MKFASKLCAIIISIFMTSAVALGGLFCLKPIQAQAESTSGSASSKGSLPVASSSALRETSAPGASHTVTFDSANGTKPTQISVPGGGSAIRPSQDPVRKGFLFDGWFQDTTAYDFSQPVVSDTVLTAHWSQGKGSWNINPTQGSTQGGTEVTLTAPSTRGIRFSRVETGGKHPLALASDGIIYTWSDDQTSKESAVADKHPQALPLPQGVHFFTSVSSGADQALAIDDQGQIWSWESRGLDQISQGSITDSALPVKVHTPDAIRFTAISAGRTFSLALDDQGRVWSWGTNRYGQLGNGTTLNQAAPVLTVMPSKTSFTGISVGDDHALALDTAGQIWSWGKNSQGQLGTQANTDIQTTPVQIYPRGVETKNIPAFTRISASGNHSLALDERGRAWVWGDQTGDDTTHHLTQPVEVKTPQSTRFTAISTDTDSSFALDAEGQIWTWNQSGADNQISGQRLYRASDNPASTISASSQGLIVNTKDGLEKWQVDVRESIGRRESIKNPLSDTTGIRGVSVDGQRLDALRQQENTWKLTMPAHSAGKVKIRLDLDQPSRQASDELDYTYTARRITPRDTTFYSVRFMKNPSTSHSNQRVPSGSTVARPADPTQEGYTFDGWFLDEVAYDFTQPVKSDLTLMAHWTKESSWRINPIQGSVLGGQTVTITPPETSGVRFSQIAGGWNHSLAIASDGTTWAWGWNVSGQLGDGTNEDRSVPVKVKVPDGTRFAKVFGTWKSSFAIDTEGHIWVWGSNDAGNLGIDGSPLVPTRLTIYDSASNPDVKFTSISASDEFTLALDTNGSVWAWGKNKSGQLGIGGLPFQYAIKPVKIHMPTDPETNQQVTFTAISSASNWRNGGFRGNCHSLALDNKGRVWAWGNNTLGELGIGSYNSAYEPKLVQSTSTGAEPRFTAIAAESTTDYYNEGLEFGSRSIALDKNGQAWAWGYNQEGGLADGSRSNQNKPVPVKMPKDTEFTNISAGLNYISALDKKGKIWVWGDLRFGGSIFNVYDTVVNKVKEPANVSASFTYTSIAAGERHLLAIGSDGNTYAWGKNGNGQLGGNKTDTGFEFQSVPVWFPLPVKATGVGFNEPGKNDASKLPVTAQKDGTWTVTTPRHNPGYVDVSISWTKGEIPQSDLILANGYEFIFVGIIPKAGGEGTLPFIIGGVLIMLAGLVISATRQKSHQPQHQTLSLE